MINIDELRQRVSDAERRFGMIDERQKAYSSRLAGMIDAVDSRQQDSDGKLREAEAALRHVKDDNEQLRSLLHQLLMAIDGAGRDHLKTPVSELSQRLETIAAAPQDAPGRVVKIASEDPVSDVQTVVVDDSVEAPVDGVPGTAVTGEEDADGSASVRNILRRMNEKIGDGASENVG